jgi:hypothetical protein
VSRRRVRATHRSSFELVFPSPLLIVFGRGMSFRGIAEECREQPGVVEARNCPEPHVRRAINGLALKLGACTHSGTADFFRIHP